MDRLTLLERLYEGFIEETVSHRFFIGLTDYIDLIDSTPEFKAVIDDLEGQRREAEKVVWKLKHPALKVLDDRHKEIESYIKKNNIQNKEIEESLQEYQDWKAGHIQSSQKICSALEDVLADIISELYYNVPEHKEFAEKYITFHDEGKTQIKRILDIPQVRAYEEADRILEGKMQAEVWGKMPRLGWIYQVVKNGREKVSILQEKLKVKREPAVSFELLNFAPLVGEWEHIERGETRDHWIIFDRAKISFIVKRLHNYILSHASFDKVLPSPPPPEPSSLALPPAASIPETFQPHLCLNKGKGCIQIYKNTKKIPIAGSSTRKFKLVQCLFSPENSITANFEPVLQNAERVLEKIALPRDKHNTKLKDLNTRKNEVESIIEYTIKDIQKIKDLQGVLFIEWKERKQKLLLSIRPREGKL